MRRLNEALYSVFSRVTFPVVSPGQPMARVVRLFDYLRGTAMEGMPSDASLRIGGEWVIGALNLIYREAWRAKRQNPKLSSAALLGRIIRSTRDIPYSELTGVDTTSKTPATLTVFSTADGANQAIMDVLNSARFALGNHSAQGSQIKTAYPQATVEDYDRGIRERALAGGSTLNLLTFDLKSKHLVDPPDLPGVALGLIQGSHSYRVPGPGSSIQRAERAIPAISLAFELPFLQLDHEGERLMRADLSAMLKEHKAISVGYGPWTAASPLRKAIGTLMIQCLKRPAQTNARNDLFFRSPQGSLGSLSAALFDAYDRGGLRPLLESYPVGPERPRSTHGLPRTLLISHEKFLNRTEGGVLYHGMSAIDALAVSVQTFQMSNSRERAHEGVGLYTVIDPDTAGHWGSEIMPLKIKKNANLNILKLRYGHTGGTDSIYWNRDLQPRFLLDLEKESALDFNESYFWLLARAYGIDIIYYEDIGYALILNQEAVDLPSIQDIGRKLMKQIAAETSINAKRKLVSDVMKVIQAAEAAGQDTSGLRSLVRTELSRWNPRYRVGICVSEYLERL